MKKFKTLACLAFALSAGSVLAQQSAPVPDPERQANRQEVRADRQEQRGDRQDLHQARRAGNSSEAQAARKDLRSDRPEHRADRQERRKDRRAALPAK